MVPKEPNPALGRVRYELRATGVKPETANSLRVGLHSRGYLPHVKREGASYFVTFRLADSLPKAVLLKFHQERAERLLRLAACEAAGKPAPAGESAAIIERDCKRQIERYLDKGAGECHLRRADIAGLVAGALSHFEGKRYVLGPWVVMPNHVHVVFRPIPNHTLSEIVRSWKGYSAHEVNRLLQRTGTFWQPEPFDHWIRNDTERDLICRYVVFNPVKARLCATPEQWRWSSAWSGARP